jgi:hypothetical protein
MIFAMTIAYLTVVTAKHAGDTTHEPASRAMRRLLISRVVMLLRWRVMAPSARKESRY